MTELVHEDFRNEVNDAINDRDFFTPSKQYNVEKLKRLREELMGLRPKLPAFGKRVKYGEMVKGMWVPKSCELEIELREFGNTEIETNAQEIGKQIYETKCLLVDEYQQFKREIEGRRTKGRKALLAEAV
jgi:hypothetical protein